MEVNIVNDGPVTIIYEKNISEKIEMNMRIKRKRSDNTILWLISTMLVLFVLAGGMYYINSKINPSANG